MKKILVVGLGVVILSGCATQKQMAPIGGSKADGTVRMGYNFGIFEKPVVDLNSAKNLAEQKCKKWGYTGAEAFGGQISSCAQAGDYGCNMTNVSIEYQCTGGKASDN